MLCEQYTDDKGRSVYCQATRKRRVFIGVINEDGDESGVYLTPEQARSVAADLETEVMRAEATQ